MPEKFAHYEGETGYIRGLEHMEDLWDEKEDKHLWNHCVLEDIAVKQSLTMKVLKYFDCCPQIEGEGNQGLPDKNQELQEWE